MTYETRKGDMRTIIGSGFVLTVFVLVINAVIAISHTYRVRKNNSLVLETDAILTLLEKTLSTVKDAETGQRGFLITGVESYLEPFQTAVTSIEDDFVRLSALRLGNGE